MPLGLKSKVPHEHQARLYHQRQFNMEQGFSFPSVELSFPTEQETGASSLQRGVSTDLGDPLSSFLHPVWLDAHLHMPSIRSLSFCLLDGISQWGHQREARGYQSPCCIPWLTCLVVLSRNVNGSLFSPLHVLLQSNVSPKFHVLGF